MIRHLLLLLCASLVPSLALADSIDPFVGYWTGTADGHIQDSEGLSLSSRDLDVTVEKNETGFVLYWSTKFTAERGKDKNESKMQTLAFTRQHDDFYIVENDSDPANGKPMIWARIEDRVLSVQSVLLDTDGHFHMATWQRELVNDREMRLRFVRRLDNTDIRFVRGGLIKVY